MGILTASGFGGPVVEGDAFVTALASIGHHALADGLGLVVCQEVVSLALVHVRFGVDHRIALLEGVRHELVAYGVRNGAQVLARKEEDS